MAKNRSLSPVACGASLILTGFLLAVPMAGVRAQSLPIVPAPDQTVVETQSGDLSETARTAKTGTGDIGQRQKREDAPSGIAPLARIETRIQNRIQNRIANRLDRNFQPPAPPTSPFERAEDRIKAAGRPGPLQ